MHVFLVYLGVKMMYFWFYICLCSFLACVAPHLDRVGGEGVVTKMFPDVQKIFRTYNNFSENTIIFQIHFLMS